MANQRKLFLVQALLIASTNFANAQSCYPSIKLPRIIYQSANNKDVWLHSAAGSETLNAIFVGGYTETTSINNNIVGNYAVIARMDLAQNTWAWRKQFTCTGCQLETITGLAVNSAGSMVAAHATELNAFVFNEISYIFIVRSEDGHFVVNARKIQHGPTTKGEFPVYSDGMYFDPYGMVYMAHSFEGSSTLDSDNGSITTYASKFVVSAYNVNTKDMGFYWHQSLFFGQAGAIAYADYGSTGSNVYVGGATDKCYTTAGSSKCWTLGIIRIKPSGKTESQTQIKMAAAYDTSESEYAMIDHMRFQNDHTVAGNWLFGTTRNKKWSNSSKLVYIFRLDLDSSHNPRQTNLELRMLSTKDFKGSNMIAGIKNKMNGDIISMVYWDDAKKLYYLQFSFTQTTVTSILIYNNVLDRPFTVFMGSGSQITRGNTVYQSYTIGTSLKFQVPPTDKTLLKNAGAIFPSIFDSKNCMDIQTTTYDIKVNDMTAATLEFFSSEFQASKISGYPIQSDVTIKSYSHVADQYYDETWCSTFPTPPTLSGGSVSSDLCFWWDNNLQEFSFSPITNTCTDSGKIVDYAVTLPAALDPQHVKVSLDSYSNKIRLTALSSGSGSASGLQTITVTGTLPDRVTKRSFTFKILPSNCKINTFTAPVSVNQSYYVTNPYASYTYPDFTASLSGCTATYTNSIAPVNTWITGVSNSNGSGKVVGWSTNNEVNIGSYAITVTARDSQLCSNSTATGSYTLTVITQCWVTALTIDSANSLFKTPALTQNIWQTASDLTWTDSLVMRAYPSVDCGALSFSVANQDGTALDSTVFTTTLSSTAGATQTLRTYTNNSAKVKTYTLRVKAWYPNYATNVGQKDFTIIVADGCETPTLTASSLSNQIYIINSGAQTTSAFASFLVSPTYCPVTYAISSISPSLPVADTNAITINSATRIITFLSTKPSSKALYTVQVSCLTPLSVNTGVKFTFTVNFQDPCALASLTIGPSTLTSNPYTYVIDAVANVQTFLDSAVSSTEITATCPTDFTFTITKRDGSAFDTGIFTWNAAAQTLSTYTNNFSYYTNGPQLLTAKVAYAGGYAIAGSIDFQVNIGISCTSAVFDVFTINSMTHSVFGASSTQTLLAVKDSVSKVAGDLGGFTHCGAREYFISTFPSTNYDKVLSLNTSTNVLTLGLPVTALTDVNSYAIEITMRLVNYPTITKKATFTATVTSCVVTSLAKTAVSSQYYDIYTPQIQFSFVEFVQTPACAYSLVYTFWVKDSVTGVYSVLPSFISQSNKTFTVLSTSPSNVALYQVVVRGSVPSGYPSFQDELIISLDVANGCLNDQVTATGTAISDFTYYLQKDGLLSWSPTWSSTVNGCPLTFEIRRIVNSVAQALTSTEMAALTHSSFNGSLTLFSTNYALDSQVWTIKLYKKSTYSTHASSEGIYQFLITFVDPCVVAVLTISPSTLTSNPYTYVIDDVANVQTFLDSAVSSTENTATCPTDFTFTITKRDGQAFDTGIFTWNAAAQTLSTYTNNFSYYTNGPYLLTAKVAYAGGYAIAGSIDFQVNIGISCTSAVFDVFTINSMTHSVFGASSTQTLLAVQDSVSKVVGNFDGFTHCGAREYFISTTPSTNYDKVLSLDTSTNLLTLGLPATALIDVNSYAIEITMRLVNYPTIIKTATFTATVTSCVVTSLAKTAVSSQYYDIYTPQIQFSFAEFVQTPACSYSLVYTFWVKDSVTGVYSALPSFISQSNKTFTVLSTSPSNVALYQVVARGSVPSGYPSFQDELIISLDVANGCLNDQVTATGTAISDFTYNLQKDGLKSWSPTWSSSVAGCPLTFEIRRIIGVVEQEFVLTSHETSVLTHSNVNGSLALLSTNLNLNGEVWTIKLYKKSTYSTNASSEGIYKFKITFLDPCVVAVLTISPSTMTSNPYTYVIDDVANVQTFLDSAVSSTENTATCPTDFTFTITKRDGLAFDTGIFTWDAAAQTLSTYTNNFSYYTNGPYLLTAKVAYAGGYAIAGSIDFQVNIGISCTSAVFEAFTINSMTHSVFGASSTQTLLAVKDSVSKVAGDLGGFTHCGAREYFISTIPSTYYDKVLSLNTSTNVLTLGLPVTALTDVNSYAIEITMRLVNYPTITKKATFTATVTSCVVMSLAKTAVSSQYYDIYTPQIQFSFVEFVQTPACAYSLVYTFWVKDSTGVYSALPSFISQSNKTFTVLSTSPSNVALYQVVARGSAPSGYPSFQDELIISLDVTNGCLNDQVTATGTAISDFTYYLNHDGPLLWSPTWSSTVTGCPLTFEIRRIVSNSQLALTSFETDALTHSTVDGSLSLLSIDYALDGEVWTIKLYKKSTYSTHAKCEGVYQFVITFRDICWDSVLAPAFFAQATYTWSLLEIQHMPFTDMIDSSQGIACGGYTYQLEYMSSGPLLSGGGAAPDLSQYQFAAGPEIVGTLSNIQWIGTHPFRLKCTNGKPNTQPSARGVNGLFKSVYSSQIDVIIKDACESSIVNGDGAIKQILLSVTSGLSREVITLAGPTDSISAQFGNGYDVCGELKYTLNGRNIYTEKYMTFEETLNADLVDSLAFDLASFPTGSIIQYPMSLTVSLQNYSTATAAVIPVIFNYRECAPFDFAFRLATQVYEVSAGESAPDINISILQSPCFFKQTYTASLTRQSNTLPSWLSLSQDGVLRFGTIGIDQGGAYELTLRSYLDSQLSNLAMGEITIHVINKQKPVVLQFPDVQLYLQSQTTTVGSEFFYELPEVYNYYGIRMNLTVDLGQASRFCAYEPARQRISAVPSLWKNEYVGIYSIGVTAAYLKNETYSEMRTIRFTLKVLPKRVETPKVEPRFKPKDEPVKNIKEKQFKPVNTTALGPYSPLQPIPVIKKLSDAGVLTVAWDRKMKKPANLDEMPTSKVVVTEESEANEIQQDGRFRIEKGNRRNLRKTREWFQTEKEYLEYLLVMDALDIELVSTDDQQTNPMKFTWDLISYEKESMDIQLNFDFPQDRISQDMMSNEISVTFWGTEFFTCEEGIQVRYGATLRAPILRQIKPELQQKLQQFTELGMIGLAGVLIVLALVLLIARDSLLPIWIFLNTLTLIVHTVVIRAEMPDVVFVVLKTMLTFLRLDFFSLAAENHVRPPNEFIIAGYQSTQFITNMGYLLLGPLVVCLTLWILGLFKDMVTPKAWRNRSCCAPAFSMCLRVLLLTLLEICICAGLELRGRFDFEEARESKISQVGFYTAVSLLGLTFILTCYMIAGLCMIQRVMIVGVIKTKTAGVKLAKTGDIEQIGDGKTFDFLDNSVKEQLADQGSKQFYLNEKANHNQTLKISKSKTQAEQESEEEPSSEESAQLESDADKKSERTIVKSDSINNDQAFGSPRTDKPLGQSINQKSLDNSGKSKVKSVATFKSTWEKMEEIEEEIRQAIKRNDKLKTHSLENVPEDQSVNEISPVKPQEKQAFTPRDKQLFEGGAQIQQELKSDGKRQQTQTLTQSLRTEAKMNVAIQWKVKPKQAIATLFLGLWVTKPAILISIISILRCLLFATAAVLLPAYSYIQVLALLLPTILMLALVLRERYNIWRDRLIWIQHLACETAIFLTCVIFIHMSLYVPESGQRDVVGWVFLSLIGMTIFLNLILIMTQSILRLRLYCRRKSQMQILPQKALEQSVTEGALLKTLQQSTNSLNQTDTSGLEFSSSKKPILDISSPEKSSRLQIKAKQDCSATVVENRSLDIYEVDNVVSKIPKEALVDDIYQLEEYPTKSDIQSQKPKNRTGLNLNYNFQPASSFRKISMQTNDPTLEDNPTLSGRRDIHKNRQDQMDSNSSRHAKSLNKEQIADSAAHLQNFFKTRNIRQAAQTELGSETQSYKQNKPFQQTLMPAKQFSKLEKRQNTNFSTIAISKQTSQNDQKLSSTEGRKEKAIDKRLGSYGNGQGHFYAPQPASGYHFNVQDIPTLKRDVQKMNNQHETVSEMRVTNYNIFPFNQGVDNELSVQADLTHSSKNTAQQVQQRKQELSRKVERKQDKSPLEAGLRQITTTIDEAQGRMKIVDKFRRPSNTMNYDQFHVLNVNKLPGEVLNNPEEIQNGKKQGKKYESFRDLMKAQQRISRSLDDGQEDSRHINDQRKSKMLQAGATVISTPGKERLQRFLEHKNSFVKQSSRRPDSLISSERQSDISDRQVTRIQNQKIQNQPSSRSLETVRRIYKQESYPERSRF